MPIRVAVNWRSAWKTRPNKQFRFRPSPSGATRWPWTATARGAETSQRHGPAPDTDWVTGPNQLWDYDVTALRSSERFTVWYLYSLLDHFSRKAVAWPVQPSFCSEQIQTLWDLGLVNEGRLELPADQWPQSLSDRGAQMRFWRLPPRQYFKKLGIPSSFLADRARPTTIRGIRGAFRHHQIPAGLSRLLRQRAGGGDLFHRLLRLVQRNSSADHFGHAHTQPEPHRPKPPLCSPRARSVKPKPWPIVAMLPTPRLPWRSLSANPYPTSLSAETPGQGPTWSRKTRDTYCVTER